MPPASETISGQLAAFAVAQRYESLPADVQHLAHLVLLDTLGCGLAGASTVEVQRIRQATCNAAGTAGDSGLWGTGDRAPLPLAALANGAAVHAREIDDFGGCAHTGSVVIPAALGTAVRVGASGRELLTAIVVGYDVARRAMDGGGGYNPFKKRGWHSTSVCGGFGAAAAAGRLLGLDAERMQWALGYAGSNAGGTWAFIPEGAMSKRVHPGFAAQSGVMSAYLAASDVTAPATIFETDWGGFFPTYVGDAATPQEAVAGLGNDYRIRLSGFKPYAACRGIHSSIDIALELRREYGLKPDDVVRVTVRGNATHRKQLAKQEIHTVLDAQFSLPYGFAVALATGGAMLDQYTPEALRRPEILALARRVYLVIDEAVEEGGEPFLDIALRDGQMLSKRVAVARGDCLNPIEEEELRVKFRTAAGLALEPMQIERLELALASIADLANVGELAELLVPWPKPGTARLARSAS
jgi:2-methylcitrate dehydratase PrpD